MPSTANITEELDSRQVSLRKKLRAAAPESALGHPALVENASTPVKASPWPMIGVRALRVAELLTLVSIVGAVIGLTAGVLTGLVVTPLAIVPMLLQYSALPYASVLATSYIFTGRITQLRRR